MFSRKVLRSVFNLKLSQRNLLSQTHLNSCFRANQKNIVQQLESCRCIVSYERKYDQNKNVSKVTRTLITFKYLRLIKNAVRELGPILKNNQRLMFLIEHAQRNRISPDFINFAIRISTDMRATVGLYDVLLPNGCHLLIQYEDIDGNVTRHHLLGLCERFDGTLIPDETFWPKTFEQKGIILIRSNDSNVLSNLSQEQLISELGIEKCYKEADAEGVEYWKVHCDPWMLPDVKKKTQNIIKNIEEAYVGFIPKKIVTPSSHTRSSIYNVLYKLCEVPTIDNVYSNLNFSHFRQ